MNKRIKIKLTTIATREEAEATMNDLARAANEQRKLAAQRDKLVLDINARFDADFARLDEQLQIHTDTLRQWAEAHPDEFPKDRKSIDLQAGRLGFRTGTPKLALLNRTWNWDLATDAVTRWLPNFVRSKPEVDKEGLLNQRDEEIIAATLPKCGLKVTQGESFFVEPSLTDHDQRINQEL